MGLFGGKKQSAQSSEGPAVGRRRPLPSEAEGRRPQAFSYYSQRSGPRDLERTRTSTEQRDDTRRMGTPRIPVSSLLGTLRSNRISVFLLLAAIIGVLGYLLTLNTTPKVVTLTRGGNAYFLQDTSLYQQSAAKTLASSIFNRNKLTVDRDTVTSELEKHYPEIHKSSLAIPVIGQQPVVYIEPNQPSFIITATDSTAYLIDSNGRALVSVSQIADPVGLSVSTIQDKSGSRINLGDQVLSRNVISFAESFLAYLRAAGVEYGDIVLPPAAGELDVSIKGTPYYVKTNLMGDARLQAGTFLAAQGRLQKDKVVPSQYIDVRVPERAYYK